MIDSAYIESHKISLAEIWLTDFVPLLWGCREASQGMMADSVPGQFLQQVVELALLCWRPCQLVEIVGQRQTDGGGLRR